MLDFRRFDPSSCAFPRPQVPVLPQEPLRGLRLLRAKPAQHAPGRVYRQFSRGRYALHEACRAAGVGTRGALLVPAYHCRTMLDPALALGARVLLYPVHADLGPDLDALAALARTHGPVAAVLATHYFGFAKPLQALAAWCRQHGAELIEDCSHGFVLDPADGHPGPAFGAMGTTARLGIASPYKFLPVPDGGLLWLPAGAGADAITPRAAAARQQIGAWASLLRRPARGVPAAATAAAAEAAQPCGTTVEERSAAPSPHYQTAAQGLAPLAASRWVARHSQLGAIVQARRARFAQWGAASRGFAAARPLFGLDAATVPYMFPLLLDEPEPAFTRLKRQGVPIWRWDDMAVSPCPVATRYRERLLHLPCHQGLTDADMEWMTTTLRQTLAQGR